MQVIYRVRSTPAEIDARARAIAIEQSIEMPPHAVRNRRVDEQVVGRVEAVAAGGDDAHFFVTIALALETTGGEAGQLMNMLFGNSSLHPDITLVDVVFPPGAAARFGGPRWGIDGLRRLTGAHHRPLTCTALKPQGSTVAELAALAGRFATAGIDVIKDDHGLADQSSAPFAARVEAIQQAVAAANRATGGRTLYAPSLTGGPRRQLAQLAAAQAAGVGAILLAPMISGLGALQELADAGVPILAHPALAGSARIAPPLLLGKLFRLAGADAVIYPNHGGRFSFSAQLCRAVADTARDAHLGVAGAMPVPAGGMHPDRVEELAAFYGNDVMLLIGGALLEADDIDAAARAFVERVAALGRTAHCPPAARTQHDAPAVAGQPAGGRDTKGGR
jgi:ribulose-bisphosphate carboxylase large chain